MTSTEHILVVTSEERDGRTYLRYAVECPGVITADYDCRTYERCSTCTPDDQAFLDDIEDTEQVERHGVVHVYDDDVDTEWMVTTGTCWAIESGQVMEAGGRLRLHGPGRYRVRLVFDDPRRLELDLVALGPIGGAA